MKTTLLGLCLILGLSQVLAVEITSLTLNQGGTPVANNAMICNRNNGPSHTLNIEASLTPNTEQYESLVVMFNDEEIVRHENGQVAPQYSGSYPFGANNEVDLTIPQPNQGVLQSVLQLQSCLALLQGNYSVVLSAADSTDPNAPVTNTASAHLFVNAQRECVNTYDSVSNNECTVTFEAGCALGGLFPLPETVEAGLYQTVVNPDATVSDVLYRNESFDWADLKEGLGTFQLTTQGDLTISDSTPEDLFFNWFYTAPGAANPVTGRILAANIPNLARTGCANWQSFCESSADTNTEDNTLPNLRETDQIDTEKLDSSIICTQTNFQADANPCRSDIVPQESEDPNMPTGPIKLEFQCPEGCTASWNMPGQLPQPDQGDEATTPAPKTNKIFECNPVTFTWTEEFDPVYAGAYLECSCPESTTDGATSLTLIGASLMILLQAVFYNFVQ